ncbi:MAG: hypothetical protein M2R45_04528 [Verrucomicrobia subdivision 3 bacterium]|nr:hypothetical protein [Limisphaerales bacterium]MCS1416833.1 hypothetical protein [Limisphaerales bacterium]
MHLIFFASFLGNPNAGSNIPRQDFDPSPFAPSSAECPCTLEVLIKSKRRRAWSPAFIHHTFFWCQPERCTQAAFKVFVGLLGRKRGYQLDVQTHVFERNRNFAEYISFRKPAVCRPSRLGLSACPRTKRHRKTVGASRKIHRDHPSYDCLTLSGLA